MSSVKCEVPMQQTSKSVEKQVLQAWSQFAFELEASAADVERVWQAVLFHLGRASWAALFCIFWR